MEKPIHLGVYVQFADLGNIVTGKVTAINEKTLNVDVMLAGKTITVKVYISSITPK